MAEIYQIRGSYAVVDGTRVYYDHLGEGTPLICLHTAGSCSLQYHELMPMLAAAGFRVIVPDLPGHGKSLPVDWQPFRKMRDYSEFVWNFIEQLCGSEKPVVLGCSIGGAMATDLAAYHSEALLAVIAMAGGAKVPALDVAEREQPHASPGWFSYIEVGSVASCHAPMRPGKDIEIQWLHKFAPQEIGNGDLQCWGNHDVVDKMSDVSCPYLNVRGEDDFFVDDQTVTETMKNIPAGLGEAVLMSEVGHYPHFERPDKVAALVLDFLARRGVEGILRELTNDGL